MSALLKARESIAKSLVKPEAPLVRHFELLATAPGGVARLRDLILTLAVQGKLVPQDQSDEPASALEQRMRAEKDRLIAAGTINRNREQPEISEEEKPFELPAGWAWMRLPDATYNLGQGAPTEQFTYIDVAAIDNTLAIITDAKVLEASDAPSRARKKVAVGTVLYSTVRPYLKNIAVVNEDYVPRAIASTAFAVMHPHTGLHSEYLLHYLRSAVFTEFVSSKAVGIAYPAINDANFFQGVVAVPPSVEQARIVTRVKELMRLCDALEAKGRFEAAQHRQLVTTLLGTLTDSESPEALSDRWQRIAAHFDILLDRPEAVDALEQTILQLAVRGLLVSQDRSDADRSGLLKRPWHRRPHGEKSNVEEASPAVVCKRFPLPFGWDWVKASDVLSMLNGYAFKSEWFKSSGVRLLRNLNVSHGLTNWTQPTFISADLAKDFESFALRVGDIALSLDRPIISTGLKFAVLTSADLPSLLLQRVAKLVPTPGLLSPEFLVLWLQSDLFLGSIDPGRSNGVPHISTKQVGALPFALPPLAEQARIVTRVEELRRLCADLRRRLAAAQVTQAQLAEALVAQPAP